MTRFSRSRPAGKDDRPLMRRLACPLAHAFAPRCSRPWIRRRPVSAINCRSLRLESGSRPCRFRGSPRSSGCTRRSMRLPRPTNPATAGDADRASRNSGLTRPAGRNVGSISGISVPPSSPIVPRRIPCTGPNSSPAENQNRSGDHIEARRRRRRDRPSAMVPRRIVWPTSFPALPPMRISPPVIPRRPPRYTAPVMMPGVSVNVNASAVKSPRRSSRPNCR